MYNNYRKYPCSNYVNTPNKHPDYREHTCPNGLNNPMYNSNYSNQFDNPYNNYNNADYNSRSRYSGNDKTLVEFQDYGPKPFVVNIDTVTKQNDTFRTALWTGNHLQLTLMSIKVGEDIGLEIHPTLDQFIRIEEGHGLVQMGNRQDRMDFQEYVYDDYAFIIPAGKWHNLINVGDIPIKLYSIYAPPQHPKGTVHETKAIAEAAEEHSDH